MNMSSSIAYLFLSVFIIWVFLVFSIEVSSLVVAMVVNTTGESMDCEQATFVKSSRFSTMCVISAVCKTRGM